MGIFNLLRSSDQPDPDKSVLIQLNKAGSKLSKPHQIEFFLYFPTQSLAQRAAATIKAEGFDIHVEPAAKGNDWLCFSTKTMVPDLSALQKIRADFSRLAASLSGQYDGWGTQVMK
jgi:Regulator of ribonuclease activity B